LLIGRRAMVSEKEISELRKAIGDLNVFTDKPTRMCYTVTHGPECLLHEDYLEIFLPDAVVTPTSTEDVQKIVKFADKYGIPLIPSGGRSGTYGAEGMRGGIVVETKKMNKILELNEEDYRITGEAGVNMMELISYLIKRGYMPTDYPGSEEICTLGSRPAVDGYGYWENRWGPAGDNIYKIEVVLPDGSVIDVGRGSNKPTKSSTGWDLMNLFIGSRGTLGIITKVTERFTDYPPAEYYGEAAFGTFKEGLEAYLELKRSKYSNNIWRVSCSVDEESYSEQTIGKPWPKEIAMVVHYSIYGFQHEVDGLKDIAEDIIKKHNGFYAPELTEITNWWDAHSREWKGLYKKVNVSLGIASDIFSKHIKADGYSAKPIFLDPNIPDSRLIEWHAKFRKHCYDMENKEIYPNLANCTIARDIGRVLPGVVGFNKTWATIHVYRKNMNKKFRDEFLDWYKKYVELIFECDGAIATTHAWIPRDLEVEIMERNMGKNAYKLMKKIKKSIDPKNIMNPKIIF